MVIFLKSKSSSEKPRNRAQVFPYPNKCSFYVLYLYLSQKHYYIASFHGFTFPSEHPFQFLESMKAQFCPVLLLLLINSGQRRNITDLQMHNSFGFYFCL